MSRNYMGSSKTKIITALCLFVFIPLTVLISILAGDRNMYIAGVIMVILAMIPFFASFEGSRPDARKMSTLAVMTALAVVSRAAFIWLPSFKPTGGIVALTALAFGPQAGFMTGAVTMIVSNIIFGQGPWTPWQMFCYGMIGFITGLLGKKRIISEKHAIRSAIFTFITVAALSSLILDTGSVFLMRQYETQPVLLIYLVGIPYNLANAFSSALCVFIIIKPFMIMINRLKKKYGILM